MSFSHPWAHKALRGTQVLYVPNHTEGDENHPDVEKGFVWDLSYTLPIVWCRFFHRDAKTLRTTANSEPVSVEDLVIKDSFPQNFIEQLVSQIETDLGIISNF